MASPVPAPPSAPPPLPPRIREEPPTDPSQPHHRKSSSSYTQRSSPTPPPNYDGISLPAAAIEKLSLSSAPQLPPLTYPLKSDSFFGQEPQQEEETQQEEAPPETPVQFSEVKYVPSPSRPAPTPPLPAETINIIPPAAEEASAMSPLSVNDTIGSAVLRKTRGILDAAAKQQEESTRGKAARPNAVSGPLHLLKSQARGRSPSDTETPRGRSVSAQPPSASVQVPEITSHLLSHHHPSAHRASAVGGQGTRSHSAHSSEASSTNSLHAGNAGNAGQALRRRSWLPGSGSISSIAGIAGIGSNGGNSGSSGNIGGARSRANSYEPPPVLSSEAWVLTSDSAAEYNVGFLLDRQKVPELWDESGTLLVFLGPRDSGKEASFRVRASIIDESPVLAGMVCAETMSPTSTRSRARSFGGRDSLSAADAHRITSPVQSPTLSARPGGAEVLRLYLPMTSSNQSETMGITTNDLEQLMPVRNMFALLTGQPLVATHYAPTVFMVLLQVATLLREFEFGAGSLGSSGFGSSGSFGEAVDMSLGFLVEQNALADVRHSREKTLEALLLGEQLRFWPLYNEAFCHAVGKYPAMRELLRTSPLWQQLSGSTRLRLERAHLDLLTRQHSVNTRIEQFEFPSLFAGIASSTSHEAYRGLRFRNWRAGFADMRSFVHKYYKTLFGSWPPKASSRRNPFSESGLNRLVLRTLYSDLCSVYDLLVDRSSFTPRVSEDGAVASFTGGVGSTTPPLSHHHHPQQQHGHLHHHATNSSSSTTATTTSTATTTASATTTPSSASLAAARLPEIENAMMALRQILAEFDESSPPVLPPIPYDTPLLPSMTTICATYSDMTPKDQARFDKNVKEADMQTVLRTSHNADAECPEASPFLAAFEAYELREARRGKSGAELAEMRIGHWLFLYVVLQSMPILVIDAPGLNHTEGVEYFLCEPSQGRPPWVEDAGEVRKAWFQTAGGAGPLVELSADVLLYSVEATYHRSHCWMAAQKWQAGAGVERNTETAPAADAGVGVGAVAEAGAGTGAGGIDVLDVAFREPDVPRPYLGGSSMSVPDLPRFLASSDSSAAPQMATAAPGAYTYSLPLSPPEPAGADERGGSPDPLSPASVVPGTTASTFAAESSAIYPPPNTPQLRVPQQRANYSQLQQRANLRHASIGWALEPVDLSNVEAAARAGFLQPQQQSSSQLPPPPPPQQQQQRGLMVPSSQARRVASAGNLRTMVDNGNKASDPYVNTASTFDAILSNMDHTQKKKKRNSFLPFL